MGQGVEIKQGNKSIGDNQKLIANKDICYEARRSLSYGWNCPNIFFACLGYYSRLKFCQILSVQQGYFVLLS